MVRIRTRHSPSLSINTGAPQGCVLHPLLFPFTHDCVPASSTNAIIKFADDTTVVGLIQDSDKSAYRDEMKLADLEITNKLVLNISKTKDMIINLRKHNGEPAPLHISGVMVEKASSF